MTHLTFEQEEYIRETVMKKKGVTGFSVTTKKRIKDGKPVDEEVIRVYVKKKIKPEDIAPEDIIDASTAQILGIPIDVVAVGEVVAQ